MIEIIVALGLVAVMALAIVGIFSRLMTNSAVSADQAAGQLLAQAVLDRAIRVGPSDWGGLTGSRDIATGDSTSKTTFRYTVAPVYLVDSTHPVDPTKDLGRLCRVKVTVDWSNSSVPGQRQNLGRMMVERSRLTYIESLAP